MNVVGVSTICFRSFSLATALDAIRRLGADSVEVGVLGDWCPHGPAHQETDFVETVRSSGLPVFGLNIHLGDFNDPESDEKSILDLALSLLDTTLDVGASHMSLNCGRYRDRMLHPVEKDLDAVAAGIAPIARAAASRGVQLILEAPHKGNLVRNAYEARSLVERVGEPNVGLVFDTAHHHASGIPMTEALQVVGPWIRHVHLRDAKGSENAHPLGTGDVDFALLFRQLRQLDYQGPVTVEFGETWTTLEETMDVLRRSIQFVRTEEQKDRSS